MNASAKTTSRRLLVASGVVALTALSLGFGTSASAGGEPIEPIVPDFDLFDPQIELELVPIPPDDDPEITIPDDFVPIPLPDDPEVTIPDDLAPIPPDEDPDDTDPTDPTDPVDPADPVDPVDPTPGTPEGMLPETGASTMVVGGLALAATTAGAFLCLAAGRRSRSHP